MSDYLIEFPEDDVVEMLVDDVIISGIQPAGILSITDNGIYDVTEYASANVNIPKVPANMIIIDVPIEYYSPRTITVNAENTSNIYAVYVYKTSCNDTENDSAMIQAFIQRKDDPTRFFTNLWYVAGNGVLTSTASTTYSNITINADNVELSLGNTNTKYTMDNTYRVIIIYKP